MKKYYEELEVNQNASQEIIEKAYKVLAKKYHPDVNENKQFAEDKFKKISEAYEILSNEEKRKEYDTQLAQENHQVSYEEYMEILNQNKNLNNTIKNMQESLNKYSNYFQQNTQNHNNNSQAYSNNYQSNQTSNSKHKYYYTDTGKPASAFAYFKFKINQFIEKIFTIFLIIILAILIIGNIVNYNIFDDIIKLF